MERLVSGKKMGENAGIWRLHRSQLDARNPTVALDPCDEVVSPPLPLVVNGTAFSLQ